MVRKLTYAMFLSLALIGKIYVHSECIFSRSKDFRPAYGRLHEIRALIPQRTPYLACTATVTKSIREEVIHNLEMVDCEFIHTSPDRPNIFYDVCPRLDIETDFQPIVKSLTENLIDTPRTVIYCRSLNMCADLYAHFHHELGQKSYFPSGAETISDNRLFAMFHANTPQHIKEVVLQSLTHPKGVVRIVFATIALGMGVNLRDVNTVIHYGAPLSIDDYFQESGRAGRSGGEAKSIVYWKPIDCPVRREPTNTRDHEAIAVRSYLENATVCRRKWLLDYLTPYALNMEMILPNAVISVYINFIVSFVFWCILSF